jgi:hypothetical protein
MKKFANFSLIFPVFLILSSCSKHGDLDTISDPPEGTDEIIACNANNQEIFRRKGDAMYINMTNYGTQIRLDDPNFLTQASTSPNDVFASVVLQGKHQINSPAVLSDNDFFANMHQRWYSLDKDWSYSLQKGFLKIKDVSPGKMQGEFTITLIKVDYSNPKWGDTITIKGKFFAKCDHYGC